MLRAAGGCLCGAVRYRLAGEPAMVAVCHCRTCQRNTGSAFSTNVAMPREAVTIEGDGLATYESRAGSDSPPFFRSFCSRCGSPVCAQGEAYPGIVFIKAGTLDDPTQVAPSAHIFCSDQLPWVRADASTPRFPAGPGGAAVPADCAELTAMEAARERKGPRGTRQQSEPRGASPNEA